MIPIKAPVETTRSRGIVMGLLFLDPKLEGAGDLVSWFISRVIIRVTPFRALVTLLITYLLSPLPLQVLKPQPLRKLRPSSLSLASYAPQRLQYPLMLRDIP